ncbi:mitochondrial carrier protein [Zymoseptoria brevis]|uniref:Mitochondrial carrier protein n=1 Tax=Zymoseptoria brevis TaxID=1047168 RepID=A0A0F4GJW7_9PEZI|nr:mitochondrial carrier protein [Zymoseptoria brevis]
MSSNSDGRPTQLPPTSDLAHITTFPRLALWLTRRDPSAINSFAGAMAGVASGIVTCPLDVVKTKLQAQGSFAKPTNNNPLLSKNPSAVYRGMSGTMRVIVRQDGVLGLYRGLGPMLLGYLPTWAVYMAVYDSSREYFYANGYNERTRDKWVARIYASVAAGACSTLVTNPIWVIKTRLMSQVSKTASDGARTPWHYSNTFDAARTMWRAEGVKAFYSGLTPALLGLSHVAIQFPLYEYFKQEFTGAEMGSTVPTNSASDTASNTIGILAATFLSKLCATTATYPHEVLRTRLQTQQRLFLPEDSRHGIGASQHSQTLQSSGAKRIGSTDGMAYQPRYAGVTSTFKTILREEGWRAFYNGLGTNLIRAIPAAMTTMLVYENVKAGLIGLRQEGLEMKERGDDF